ncbi:uncharacterized protein LOC103699885 isoform X3 [Phoenix dactylifera]|uniref:Uncharacterized protein LOC103699885 isoform X3 n=2 Tax=Phoenix dactylifera TaxID=42345 RepID=A0A8B8J1E2_PHODC|nr:uncharacterized protein LOC103699885 isoform X3 [Phoenix dactylifera]
MISRQLPRKSPKLETDTYETPLFHWPSCPIGSLSLNFDGGEAENGDSSRSWKRRTAMEEKEEEDEDGGREVAADQKQEGSPNQSPQRQQHLYAESVGFVHQGSLGPAKGEAYRDNERISVNDPVLAECIWESGLKKVFDDIKVQEKVAVGLNPNIRFYRYKVGQRFGRHIDESVDLGEGCKTQYTY